MQQNLKVYAPLAIAGLALAISVLAAIRGSGGEAAGGAGACVDREARAELDRLRRALAERDALLARFARAPSVPGGEVAGSAAAGAAPAGSAAAASGAPAGSAAAAAAAAAADPAARRFVRFVIPNPAVSVTQKEDGSYEIRTTDRSLVGSVLQVTGIMQSGEEETLLIRIPP
jgi:hypothetical protein